MDYKFNTDRLEASAALFGKATNFNQQKEHIKGMEIFGKTNIFNNRLELQASYTLVNACRKNNTAQYPTKYDLDYFIRSSLKYKNSKFLNINLTMLYRQGTYFRRVTEANYMSSLNVYKPSYINLAEQNRLPDYLKLDLSISKLWSINENISLVSFVNVSNLLNSKNVRDKTYDFNYSDSKPLYYSKRTIYFGGVVYF
jgi:outer membrane receptor for ferrienterochelin and colicin